MATDNKAVHGEVELLRALAKQRRAESLKLAQRGMMAARRPALTGVVALPGRAVTVGAMSSVHRDAA